MFDWKVIGNIAAYALISAAIPALISFNVNPTGGWRVHLAAGAGGASTYLAGRFQQSPRPPKSAKFSR